MGEGGVRCGVRKWLLAVHSAVLSACCKLRTDAFVF